VSKELCCSSVPPAVLGAEGSTAKQMAVVSGEPGEKAHRTASFLLPVPAIRRTARLRAKTIDLREGTKKEVSSSEFGRVD